MAPQKIEIIVIALVSAYCLHVRHDAVKLLGGPLLMREARIYTFQGDARGRSSRASLSVDSRRKLSQ